MRNANAVKELTEFLGKREVEIYDYADLEVPMLKRMFLRRLRTYKQLGYSMNDQQGNASSAPPFGAAVMGDEAAG